MQNLLKEQDNDAETALRKSLAALDMKRKSMEHEADAIYLELTTPPDENVEPMGIDTPLVDQDGYPRGDIDVYRARTLRGRFRVLQTDHKQAERQIESMLQQLAAMKNPPVKEAEQAEQKARLATKPKPKYDPVTGKWVVQNWDGTVAGVKGGDRRTFENLTREMSGLTEESHLSSRNGSTRNVPANEPDTLQQKAVFARIDAVAKNSPADLAGLQEEDLIVQFGPLHAGNHNHLKAIAELVPQVADESKSIPISLKRSRRGHHDLEETILTISLQPKPWSGRGLIGCHIVPYHLEE